MRLRYASQVFAWVLLLSSAGACAQSDSPATFGTDLLQPAEVSSFEIRNERLVRLSAQQRTDLLEAKAVLVEFFRNLERLDGDPLRLMMPDFVRELRDRTAIRQALIADETTVLRVAITDFVPSGDNEYSIEFSFYATVFSEGMFAVADGRATLRKMGSDWRLSSVIFDP